MSAATEVRDLESGLYTKDDVIAGKYRLDRLLGEGGMGSVWLAHNLDIDSDVAIKLIRSDVPAREAIERLKREARAAARIVHRAIVKVYDFGETTEGHPFIVMEVLEGKSFADLLDARRPIPPVSAVTTLLPIVDGLVAAHAQGVVHRDVKPENIFLARSAEGVVPKLLDFGIAKLARGDRATDGTITVDGAVMGSPAYMSPEQARGALDVDHRADIWAICAVLYEAVAGSPPFPGAASNYNALLRRVVEDEIAPILDPAEGRSALWSVLERGLRKNRDARFPSMAALRDALGDFLASQSAGPAAADAVVPLDDANVTTLSEEPGSPSCPSGLVRSSRAPARGAGRRAFAQGALAMAALVGTVLVFHRTVEQSLSPAAAAAATTLTELGPPPPPRDETATRRATLVSATPGTAHGALPGPTVLPAPARKAAPLTFHWPRPASSAHPRAALVGGDPSDLKNPYR